MVFVPVRSPEEMSLQPEDVPGVIQYRFRHVLHRLHRVFFRTKIHTVFASLCATFDLERVDVSHAHFLYSDGAVALRLKQVFGLPYVTAVRSTDLNRFMRYRPDLRSLANRVLEQAAQIVCLSPAYKRQLLRSLGSRTRDQVEHKISVIPNGLASTWLMRPPVNPRRRSDPIRLLYVGDFSRNKNLRNVLRAAKLLAADREVQLTLVGGGGNAEHEVLGALRSGAYPFTTYVGRINDAERLREVYRSHDIFLMPSFLETFGVAYVEALSQGLPVIHAHGQGVDGLLPHGVVSEAVDPYDPKNIASKVTALAERREEAREICIDSAKQFDWRTIAESYIGLYRSARGKAGS